MGGTLLVLSALLAVYSIEYRPNHPVLRVEGSAPVELRMPFEPEAILSSAGEITNLHFDAQHEQWAATLLPPKRSVPQAVVVLALAQSEPTGAANVEVGLIVIPWCAEVLLRGRSEVGSTVTVELGQKRFGPIQTGTNAHFKIPVVVAPGQKRAEIKSVDGLGNLSHFSVPLYLPAVRDISILSTSTTLRAGEKLDVYVVRQTPLPRALKVHATHGVLIDRGALNSRVHRFVLHAPQQLSGTHDTIELSVNKNTTLSLRLSAGPASVIKLLVPEMGAELVTEGNAGAPDISPSSQGRVARADSTTQSAVSGYKLNGVPRVITLSVRDAFGNRTRAGNWMVRVAKNAGLGLALQKRINSRAMVKEAQLNSGEYALHLPSIEFIGVLYLRISAEPMQGGVTLVHDAEVLLSSPVALRLNLEKRGLIVQGEAVVLVRGYGVEKSLRHLEASVGDADAVVSAPEVDAHGNVLIKVHGLRGPTQLLVTDTLTGTSAWVELQ